MHTSYLLSSFFTKCQGSSSLSESGWAYNTIFAEIILTKLFFHKMSRFIFFERKRMGIQHHLCRICHCSMLGFLERKLLGILTCLCRICQRSMRQHLERKLLSI